MNEKTPSNKKGNSRFNFENVYHITSTKNFRDICRDRFLQNRSSPYFLWRNVDRAIREKVPEYWESKHITGAIDSPDFAEWKEYGLFEPLIQNIILYAGKPFEIAGPNIRKYTLPVLRFGASDIGCAFITDHAPHSPRRFKELYGDVKWMDTSKEDSLNQERVFRQQKLRDDTLVSAQRYTGDYEVPEIWVPHKISLEHVAVDHSLEVTVGKSADEEFTQIIEVNQC